ncbi:phage terminase small subunit [Cytobacillus oceanisediminis]|uniref:phage terminase small subunit n=1 Tax=Cytobacillus oceanisediminis TaxID=665099 RepID=UPI0024949EFB|nr:phage terminase small subunit [Cytobacillus oceanisediminis]
MVEKHVQAEKDYVKGMKYKDIAEKYQVSLNTVKSWKKRYGWKRDRGAPKEKGVHTKKRGAPKGNINAKGNRGGAAPKGNSNAVTHGFFSKFLPEESLEIMNHMQEHSPADLIWDQIQIQYAAIIRAQKIMFVENKDDITKVLKKKKDSNLAEEREWEYQFAWDKHANFLNAQSRAMGELRSLIKQFDEMAHIQDERRLKLELMRASIEKTKAEIKQEGGDASKVVIVNDKEAMRKALLENDSQNH